MEKAFRMETGFYPGIMEAESGIKKNSQKPFNAHRRRARREVVRKMQTKRKPQRRKK